MSDILKYQRVNCAVWFVVRDEKLEQLSDLSDECRRSASAMEKIKKEVTHVTVLNRQSSGIVSRQSSGMLVQGSQGAANSPLWLILDIVMSLVLTCTSQL